MDTWHERTSPLDQVSQLVWGEEKRGRDQRKERERDLFRERSSHFSISFPTIGPVFGSGARGRVDPHSESFASRPVLGSLDKLRKGRGFSPTCFTLCLRVILMGGDLLRPGWPWFRFQKIWT